MPLIVPILNILGCMWRGYYCYLAASFMLVLIPVVDAVEVVLRNLFAIEPARNKTPYKPIFGKEDELTPYVLMLWFFVPSYIFVMLYSASVYGDLSGWEIFGLVNSVAVTGTFTMTAVHELGHKRNKICQILGAIGAGVLVNPDFVYEHYSFHHAQAATPNDPQSSYMGNTIYPYIVKTISTIYYRGFKKLLNKFASGTVDRLAGWLVLVISSTTLCYMLGGFFALSLYVIHTLLTFTYVTSLNYVQHYGMLRKMLPNGEYEPINLYNTAWDIDFWMTNICFWEAGRHAEHHAYPRKLYYNYGGVDAPRLPRGLMSMIYIAMIPPLWFWYMDSRVIAHHKEIEKLSSRKERAQLSTKAQA